MHFKKVLHRPLWSWAWLLSCLYSVDSVGSLTFPIDLPIDDAALGPISFKCTLHLLKQTKQNGAQNNIKQGKVYCLRLNDY